MPKPVKQKRSEVNHLAHHLASESTQENSDTIQLPTKEQISMLMAQLGKRGGKIGGKRRLETLSSAQRKQIAKKAAHARWDKRP